MILLGISRNRTTTPAEETFVEESSETNTSSSGETTIDEQSQGPNKGQELWETFKGSMAKIPHGIEEPENKLKLTTSKLFALTGALLAFFEGRILFLSYASLGTTAYPPIVGGIGMLIGLFLLTTILVDFILVAKPLKGKIPYEWFILFPSGMLLFFLNLFASNGGYFRVKGGTLLMIGGLILLLEGLKIKKIPPTKALLAFVGCALGVYEAIRVIVSAPGNIWAIFTAIIMFIILILLFLATNVIPIPEKIRPPLSWWFALCVAVAMYYFGYQLSGTVLIHIFLLELIEL